MLSVLNDSLKLTVKKAGLSQVLRKGKYKIHAVIVYIQWFCLRFRKEDWIRMVLYSQKEILPFVSLPYSQDRYEGPFWWWNIPQWLLEAPQSDRPLRILDIGVGHGTLFQFCKANIHCELHGLTIDYGHSFLTEDGIMNLQKSNDKSTASIKFSNVEMVSYPEWSAYFDVIIMTEVLEHFNANPVPTLKKIRELIKLNGHLFISTPDAEYCGLADGYSDWREIPNPDSLKSPMDNGHTYQYNSQEIEEIASFAGFGINKLEKSVPFGLNNRHLNIDLIRL